MGWVIDKEYPVKCGGKMLPKKIYDNGVEAVYIRPDQVGGGEYRVSLWNLDGSHAGGFGHGPDPLLDVVGEP